MVNSRESNSMGTSCVRWGLDEGGCQKLSPTLAEWQNGAVKCAVLAPPGWVGRHPRVGMSSLSWSEAGCCHGFQHRHLCLMHVSAGWGRSGLRYGLYEACGPARSRHPCVSASGKDANRDQTQVSLTGQTNTESGWWKWASSLLSPKIWPRARVLFLQRTSYQWGWAASPSRL